MLEWWSGLEPLAQAFFGFAVFFAGLFLWQVVGALFGLAGHSTDMDMSAAAHADVPADVHAGHPEHVEAGDGAVGAAQTALGFKLMSVRSILAFFLLFFWAGGFYLMHHTPVWWAMFYSILWGLAAMLIVSGLLYFMKRMTETGSPRLATSVGQPSMVYADIPAGGTGQIRTLVGGVVTVVAARAAGGEALKAGTPVKVRRCLDATTVEVEKVPE